jgi:hypothetical protein
MDKILRQNIKMQAAVVVVTGGHIECHSVWTTF